MNDDTSAHWRDSAWTPKFFVIDARAAFGVLLVLLNPKWWTLGVAFVFIALLVILNYFKLPIGVVMKVIRSWLTGPKKILVYRK